MKNLLKNKTVPVYTIAFFSFVISIILGILLGSTSLSIRDIFNAVFYNSNSPEAAIFWYVRLPRTLAALLVGAALSVSGAVIQSVLANRLASPSIIGVNSGAGLAVTICAAFGVIGGFKLSFFAFIGAFLAVMLISIGARKWGASRGTVILMGVALNSILGAVSDAIIAFYPEISIMSSDFKVGDFSAVTYQKLLPASVFIILTLIALMTLSNELEVLTMGDDNARGLGLNTGLFRTVFLLLAAILAGAAVSLAGLLSFVGLLVPHAVRMAFGTRLKHLIPLSALFGATFVTLCDTLSRFIFAPYEIPVGIIMSLIGAPFFVFILIKSKGGHKNA